MKMDFEFSRLDYIITGLTFPDCLKLLPSANAKSQQKIAVGDKDGILQLFSIVNEEPQVHFKSLPGKEITCLELGGTPGNFADKIFIASGNEVRGYTKKGKLFLALETTLSETITSMCVLGGDLIIGSGNTLSHYKDLQEVFTFVCEERILDTAIVTTFNSPRIRIMASITSKSVLLLEHGRLIAKLVMNAACTRFLVPPVDFTRNKEPFIFYGTQNGTIGIIIINSQMELEEKSLVDGSGLGGVSCLTWWTGPMSCNYLLVGRHDGSVQVFLLDMDNFPEKPKLKFSYFCGETVTSVVGGHTGRGELVVSTYSGRIFGLRPQDDAPNSQTNVSSRLAKLEAEVNKLEKLVYQERENYQKTTHATLFTGLSAPPLLALKEELSGMRPDGWQELQMSCATPIDILFIVCSKPITLQTDSASAVLSISPLQENNEFQATIRCQAGMHSIWLKLKCEEQRAMAILKIYVIPAGAPRIARLKTYNLCPLSAYDQYQAQTGIEGESRSWNKLNVNGPFSVAEMSAWLSTALPGELPRPGPKISFSRRHTILDTVLACQYQKGEASFKSNNITTISVLKELLSNSAIKKNIRIDIHCDIDEDTVLTGYRQISPKIEYEYNNSKKLFLKNALSELDINMIHNQEKENSIILCDEYMELIKETDLNIENNLSFYIDVVIDWFKDFRKLKVLSFNDKDITQLKEALNKNDVDEITKIIASKLADIH